MYFANEEEKPKLRFVNRNNQLVLQERLKIRRDFKNYEVWRDVPIVEETTDEIPLEDGYTYD